MKFNSVIIKNFRNFEDISIDLTNKNVFFGMNDVGKTNFLYALRFVFDKDIRKQNFSDTDYYKKKVDVPIEIVIAIDISDTENADSQKLRAKLKGAILSEQDIVYIKVKSDYDEKEMIGVPVLYWGGNVEDLEEMKVHGTFFEIDYVFNVIYIDAYVDLYTLFKAAVDESKIYFLYRCFDKSSELYKMCEKVVNESHIRGKGHAIYEGIITEIEKEIKKLCERDIDEIDTVIEDTVTAKAQSGDVDEMANLFNSVSFRDFVMTGYKNKCAITGNVIRYGSFMNLEAAHIWPRSHKGLYLPSNGIALCRDMHWAFDKGMFTIDDNFKVIVHPEVESNYLKKYNRKSLFIPENAFFRPDINNLHYHQTHIYGLFKTSGSLVKAAGYYGNTASVVSMVAEGKGSYGSNSNN